MGKKKHCRKWGVRRVYAPYIYIYIYMRKQAQNASKCGGMRRTYAPAFWVCAGPMRRPPKHPKYYAYTPKLLSGLPQNAPNTMHTTHIRICARGMRRGYAPGLGRPRASKCPPEAKTAMRRVCAEGMRRPLPPPPPPRPPPTGGGMRDRVCAGGMRRIYIYIYIYICSNSSGKCYFQGGMRRGYAPYIYIYIPPLRFPACHYVLRSFEGA